jgi:hypothetical protein
VTAAINANNAAPNIEALENVLKDEIKLALRLHRIQSQDSRIGFEASNQYYYVPADLLEKTLHCRYLLAHWIPRLREPHPQ